MIRASFGALVAALLVTPEARAAKLVWPEDVPHFRVSEYAAVGVLLGVNLYVELGMKSPMTAGWTRPILFDNAARTAFRLPERDQRESLSLLSDLTLHIPQFQPVVLDAAIAIGRGSWETAWQIEMMSAMGAGITGVLTRVPLNLLGRERPDAEECRKDRDYSVKCNRGTYSSFPSGHTSFAFTGAALSCAHHLRLHLWDSRAADIATCVAGLTLATTTAVTRLMMDRHWASDVLIGAGIGLASGFGVAYLLHYAPFVAIKTKDVRATFVPATFGTAIGAQMVGVF